MSARRVCREGFYFILSVVSSYFSSVLASWIERGTLPRVGFGLKAAFKRHFLVVKCRLGFLLTTLGLQLNFE